MSAVRYRTENCRTYVGTSGIVGQQINHCTQPDVGTLKSLATKPLHTAYTPVEERCWGPRGVFLAHKVVCTHAPYPNPAKKKRSKTRAQGRRWIAFTNTSYIITAAVSG